MSTDTTNLNIASFLDKIRRLYPYGIAQQNLIVLDRAAVARVDIRCLLLVVKTGIESLPTASRGLLEGIYSKGLRLRLDECLILDVNEGEYSSEMLAAKIRTSAISTAVVFGASGQPGLVEVVEHATVLFARPIDSIAADVGAKRELWKQLQEVILPRLSVG